MLKGPQATKGLELLHYKYSSANVYYSTAENSPQQMHHLCLFQQHLVNSKVPSCFSKLHSFSFFSFFWKNETICNPCLKINIFSEKSAGVSVTNSILRKTLLFLVFFMDFVENCKKCT